MPKGEAKSPEASEAKRAAREEENCLMPALRFSALVGSAEEEEEGAALLGMRTPFLVVVVVASVRTAPPRLLERSARVRGWVLARRDMLEKIACACCMRGVCVGGGRVDSG